MSNVKTGKNLINKGATIGEKSMRDIESKDLVIGDNAYINSGTVIYFGSKIGNDFRTGHGVVVREECELGDNVSLWGGVTLDYGVKLGNNVKIHTGCYVAQYTEIDDNVFMAPGVVIGNDPHPGCKHSYECIKKFAVKIEKGAQIGLNVTILPGVTIGKGSLIGAGAVVVKDVPDNAVVIGNPGKVVKKTQEIECLLPSRKGFMPYK